MLAVVADSRVQMASSATTSFCRMASRTRFQSLAGKHLSQHSWKDRTPLLLAIHSYATFDASSQMPPESRTAALTSKIAVAIRREATEKSMDESFRKYAFI